jgi:hypothetical protein
MFHICKEHKFFKSHQHRCYNYKPCYFNFTSLFGLVGCDLAIVASKVTCGVYKWKTTI